MDEYYEFEAAPIGALCTPTGSMVAAHKVAEGVFVIHEESSNILVSEAANRLIAQEDDAEPKKSFNAPSISKAIKNVKSFVKGFSPVSEEVKKEEE